MQPWFTHGDQQPHPISRTLLSVSSLLQGRRGGRPPTCSHFPAVWVTEGALDPHGGARTWLPPPCSGSPVSKRRRCQGLLFPVACRHRPSAVSPSRLGWALRWLWCVKWYKRSPLQVPFSPPSALPAPTCLCPLIRPHHGECLAALQAYYPHFTCISPHCWSIILCLLYTGQRQRCSSPPHVFFKLPSLFLSEEKVVPFSQCQPHWPLFPALHMAARHQEWEAGMSQGSLRDWRPQNLGFEDWVEETGQQKFRLACKTVAFNLFVCIADP